MNKRRLLKLADFLETKVPKKHFNMDHFGAMGFPVGQKVNCKMSACAGGWATQIPSFKRAGLKFIGGDEMRDIEFEGDYDFSALAKFFEIHYQESDHIFGGPDDGRHETPKQVAKRIRKFVEHGMKQE